MKWKFNNNKMTDKDVNFVIYYVLNAKISSNFYIDKWYLVKTYPSWRHSSVLGHMTKKIELCLLAQPGKNLNYPFPTCRRFLMPLQQTTFENIETKEEIACNEQFLVLRQCFQLFSIIIVTFIEVFFMFVYIFS